MMRLKYSLKNVVQQAYYAMNSCDWRFSGFLLGDDVDP